MPKIGKIANNAVRLARGAYRAIPPPVRKRLQKEAVDYVVRGMSQPGPSAPPPSGRGAKRVLKKVLNGAKKVHTFVKRNIPPELTNAAIQGAAAYMGNSNPQLTGALGTAAIYGTGPGQAVKKVYKSAKSMVGGGIKMGMKHPYNVVSSTMRGGSLSGYQSYQDGVDRLSGNFATRAMERRGESRSATQGAGFGSYQN